MNSLPELAMAINKANLIFDNSLTEKIVGTRRLRPGVFLTIILSCLIAASIPVWSQNVNRLVNAPANSATTNSNVNANMWRYWANQRLGVNQHVNLPLSTPIVTYQKSNPSWKEKMASYFSKGFWSPPRDVLSDPRNFGLGFFFLLGMTFFPRITMFLAMLTPWTALIWIGWIIAPHITVAFIAYQMYWQTNPELCLISFVMAFVGTRGEIIFVQRAIKEEEGDERKFFETVFIVIIVLAVLVIFYLILWLLGKLFLFLLNEVSTANAVAIGTVFILILGSGLYFFRQSKKALYGIVEIISAVVLGAFALAKASGYESQTTVEFLSRSDILGTIVAISSSVYIVVRGLDNIGEENLKNLPKKFKKIRNVILRKKSAPPSKDQTKKNNGAKT